MEERILGQNFLCISGDPGSGKTAACKELLEILIDYQYYSTGEEFRKIALAMDIPIINLCWLAEREESIDNYLDNKLDELGQAQDKYIVDSRMAWYFIPNSISIYLTVNSKVAAERIMAAERVTEKYSNPVEAEKLILSRRRSEQKRYNSKYHKNIYNFNNYDIVIDTSKMTIKEISKQILINYVSKRLNRPLTDPEIKKLIIIGIDPNLEEELSENDKKIKEPKLRKKSALGIDSNRNLIFEWAKIYCKLRNIDKTNNETD